MRHIYLLITVAALLVGCASQHNNDSSTIYDSGVSRELADWRKATIADLRYNLHFEIPAERSSEVVANVEILFRLDTPQEIVIDFRDLQGIKSVCNNVGEIIEYTAENEHIIIPESYTQIGENSINIEFIAGSQSLNRNDEFLYTLLVPDRARTLFPASTSQTSRRASHSRLPYPKSGAQCRIPLLVAPSLWIIDVRS